MKYVFYFKQGRKFFTDSLDADSKDSAIDLFKRKHESAQIVGVYEVSYDLIQRSKSDLVCFGYDYLVIKDELNVSSGLAELILLEAVGAADDGFDGLQTGARNILSHYGLYTKEDTRRAYEAGCFINKPNLGKVRMDQILDWIGVVDPKDMPNEKTINQYKTYLEKHGYSVTLTRK
jgi:hypothetical protein